MFGADGLSNALVKIRSLCLEIQKIQLFRIKSHSSYPSYLVASLVSFFFFFLSVLVFSLIPRTLSLQEFVVGQGPQRKSAKEQLTSLSEKVGMVCLHVFLHDYVRSARFAKNAAVSLMTLKDGLKWYDVPISLSHTSFDLF